MKNLKLFLLTLISVISLNLFSQTQVYTTNTSGPNICDGTAVVDTTTLYGNILTWNYQGAPIQVGGYMIDSLCPGTYTFTYIDTTNSFEAVAFTIGYDTTTNVGDTLVITNAGTCNNPMGTLTSSIEDCTLNYNAVDSVYISNLIYPSNPLDGTVCVWNVIDTNGVNLAYTTVYTGVMTTGCYNFQLIIYCTQKSMNYKTIIVSQTENIGFAGINEISGNSKQLVSVVDLMGKEVSIQPNKFLIYTYSDGSREIKYINE